MLAQHERRKIEVRGLITAEIDRHLKALGVLRAEFALADEAARLCVANIDADKVLLAEHVITVTGSFEKAGEDRRAMLERAIADLLAGAPKLRTAYLGTKDYAHWHGQGIECEYGYGPKHGSVIFRIELNRPVREALKQNGNPLSEEGIDAAVYYLRNIERIQAAQAAAKAAAATA